MTGDETPLWGQRRSRWARSEITFGPVGRIVMSLLMLVPLWWFIRYAGVFGLVGLPIWLVKVLPWGLQDIWRPVKVPATDADMIRAKHELLQQTEAAPPHGSVSGGQAPKRW
jgi:hypothetical protein